MGRTPWDLHGAPLGTRELVGDKALSWLRSPRKIHLVPGIKSRGMTAVRPRQAEPPISEYRNSAFAQKSTYYAKARRGGTSGFVLRVPRARAR